MPKPSSKALGKRKAAAPPSKVCVMLVLAPHPLTTQTSKKSRPSRPGKSSSHRETELGPTGKPKRGPDQPKKVKLRDQKIIPVPMSGFENDEGSEDGLMDLGEEEGLEVGGSASAFLKGLDRNALSR
jgi:nucleolar complex protein 3